MPLRSDNSYLRYMRRGSHHNPKNRFESTFTEEKASDPRTQFIPDHAKTIIRYNNSPDVPFSAGINPYRGCEHGCIYCYARPGHEYLGHSAGLDFESKIYVKYEAPTLLRRELQHPKWKPQAIAISGVTDAYQPVEKRLGITRQCLRVLQTFHNPCGIITKNQLVTRDKDILGEMAKWNGVRVYLSITTLDAQLARTLEPRTSTPNMRLRALRELSDAGIPTGVSISPVIPGLTDHELPAILQAAADAGAQGAFFIPVRLPHGVADLFTDWLSTHYPDRSSKVLNRIREMRGGVLNDPDFGSRMQAVGPWYDQLQQQFALWVRKLGFPKERLPLSTSHFTAEGRQLGLF